MENKEENTFVVKEMEAIKKEALDIETNPKYGSESFKIYKKGKWRTKKN